MKIGIVGPCGAGKSTLEKGLLENGYDNVISIAQEHSYVKDMWKRITNPDVLICLQAKYETTIERKNLKWTIHEYENQLERLRHARQHADIIIETDNLSISEVLERTLTFLKQYSH